MNHLRQSLQTTSVPRIRAGLNVGRRFRNRKERVRERKNEHKVGGGGRLVL
jgi:hypothetical protein